MISGQGATIGFGAADARGPKQEISGIEVQAGLGDVLIALAGVAHKIFNPRPGARGLKVMSPEDAVDAQGARKFFDEIPVTKGFMMMGGCPCGEVWDSLGAREHGGKIDEGWSVPIPDADPVLETSCEGLFGLWKTKGL